MPPTAFKSNFIFPKRSFQPQLLFTRETFSLTGSLRGEVRNVFGVARGSCSAGDLPDRSSSLPQLSPAFWSFCRGMATLLNLLVWVIFSKGIWLHERPGMGKGWSPVASNGLGSSWVVVGGSLVALVCEGGGGPMGCLTYPPTKVWEASRRLLQRCSIASQRAWHNLGKEPLAGLPPPQPFSWLRWQKGPQSNNELQLCIPL